MDSEILKALESTDAELRRDALEQLRESVRKNNGQLLVGNLKRLFEVIADRMLDQSASVSALAVLFAGDIIPELGADLHTYFATLLPGLVINLSSSAEPVRHGSLSAIKSYVRHSGNLQAVATALQEHGFTSDRTSLRQCSLLVIPTIVQQVEVAGVDSKAMVMAIVERLEDPAEEVVQAAVKALLGVRGLLGDSARKYIDSLRLSQYKRSSSHSRQHVVDSGRGSREDEEDANGMRFGVVPSQIVGELQVDDWKVRSSAIEKLLVVISQLEDVRPMLPHLKGLLRLLGPLLDDPNFKIALTSIQITGELVDKAQTAIGAFTDFLMPLLMEKIGDKKIVIRQGTMRVMVKLMRAIGAGPVTTKLIPFSSHKNPHVREEVLTCYMHAILSEGCDQIDLPQVVRVFRNGLFDAKDKVRFVAMEAFALLRSKLGEVAVEQFLAGIGDDVVRPLQLRFKDKSLPVIGAESGLVEHSVRDNMASAATSDDMLVQRPRHQSAGAHQGKIPWKMPTLKSRVGPSSSGRRNRSAAAVIISGNKGDSKNLRVINTGIGPRQGDSAYTAHSDAESSPVGHSPLTHGVDSDLDMEGIDAPHVSMEWKRHADTDSQVENALRGMNDLVNPLYPDDDRRVGYSPSFGINTKKTPRPSSRHSPSGGRTFGQFETDTWQSVSPTTPASGVFPSPGARSGGSISPGLLNNSPGLSIGSGMLPLSEADMGYSSSKTSLWLPGSSASAFRGSTPREGGSSRQSDYSSMGVGNKTEPQLQQKPQQMPMDRNAALATLKTKRKTGYSGGQPPYASHSEVVNTCDIGFEAEWKYSESSNSGLPKATLSHTSIKRREMQRQKRAEMAKQNGEGSPPQDLNGDLVMGRKVGHSEGQQGGSVGMGLPGGSMGAVSPGGAFKAEAGSTVPTVPPSNDELGPLPNSGLALNTALEDLKIDKWDKQLEATTLLRRLAKHHPEKLRPIVKEMMKDFARKDGPVMSLRSNLSRNALICLSDLLASLGKDFDPHLEDLVKLLMGKCSEASGFINAEAERAMMSLVDNTTDSRSITALQVTADHRNPVIRGKTAQFIDRWVQKQGSKLHPKELDRLVPMLASMINDSNQEARAHGKRSLYHLHKLMPMDLDRASRRLLSALNVQKVEQTIAAGKTNGGFGLSNESAGGRRRYGSTKSGGGNNSNALSIDTNSHGIPKGRGAEELNSLISKLGASDTKGRLAAIDALSAFVKTSLDVCKGQAGALMDAMAPCLSDSNIKVNVRALDAMQVMVPALGHSLDAGLMNLVQLLAESIAATNKEVMTSASGVLDCMFGCTDKFAVVRAMCSSIQYGNPSVKAAMLSKVTEVVKEIFVENPAVIQQSVVPLAVHIAETESKGEVRLNVNALLTTLSLLMKGGFMEALDSLNLDQECKARISGVVQNGGEGRKNMRR